MNMTNLWVFKITHFQSPSMVLLKLQVENYSGLKWVRNRIPKLVARWYFDFIYETRVIPNYIRIDY